MLAKHEHRTYTNNQKIWVGKYKNSHNLLHWHYDCELIAVERGSIEVFCDKRSHLLGAGDALFIDSGQVHYMNAEEGTVLVTMFFDSGIIEPITQSLRLKSPKLSRNYGILDAYARIFSELSTKPPFYELRARTEIINLFLDIYRGEETLPADRQSGGAEQLKGLFTEIARNYEFFDFEDGAKYMNMSPSYFSRLFRKITGLTFSTYLNCVKIEHAVALLNSPDKPSVTDVAIKCGFSTIRNFNRIFKQLTGYPPSALPPNFIFDNQPTPHSDQYFNPTLSATELIETV